MSRRRKIAIAVVLAAVLAALIYLYLRSRQEVDYAFPEPTEPTPVSQQPSNLPPSGGTAPVETPVTPTQPKAALTPEQNDQAEIRRLAAAFAEKFGSFSSLSDYENILDLKVFMTDSMAKWADGYVKEARDKRAGSDPFGTTTRSLVTDLKSFDAAIGAATVNVTTQREEIAGQPGEETRRVYYQDMKVDFIKTSDSWKIDGAYWQKQ